MKYNLALLIFCIFTISCKNNHKKPNEELTISEKIISLKDTLDFGDFKVYNVYKTQAITYRKLKKETDSIKIANQIINDLLEPYPVIFKNCFSFSKLDFVSWNNKYINNDSIINKRIEFITKINLDSIIELNYKSVSELSGHKPTGAWYAYFFGYPDMCDMCGCDLNAMQLNLAYPELSKEYFQYLFPHELNHNIYDLTNGNDPDNKTVLWDIINEGFATYFSKKHSDLSIIKAFTPYKDGDYEWCLKNEKKIFEKAKPILFSTNGSDFDDLGTSDRNTFIENSPGKLGYFIGYRIIEEYVKKNGEDSWKDVYNLPVRKLLEESGYEKYIKELK